MAQSNSDGSRNDRLVLGTVNASIAGAVIADELARWIRSGETDDAYAAHAMLAFFVEIDIALQVRFLEEHGISIPHAIATARTFGSMPADLKLERLISW